MPDPKLHLDADGRVILPDLDSPGIPAHCQRAQIAACTRCDSDGYRSGSTVCDHQDHASAETRAAAREALRVALAKGKS